MLQTLPSKPYRGLRYYTEKDDAIFAGRDRDATQCSHALRRARIIILHGSTGCGKSSFLRAALKPTLERGDRMLRFPAITEKGAASGRRTLDDFMIVTSRNGIVTRVRLPQCRSTA